MKKHMKLTVLATSLLLSLPACAQQTATNDLGTSVSGRHIADVTRDVKGWHDSQNPDCPFSRAVKVKVLERDGDGVTERWTIEGCNGRSFDYEAYIMSMNGGITVMVSDPDVSPTPAGP